MSHRNGYEPRKVRTTSGTVALERPRVRDASRLGFESRVLGEGVTRTYALESLVIGSFLRRPPPELTVVPLHQDAILLAIESRVALAA